VCGDELLLALQVTLDLSENLISRLGILAQQSAQRLPSANLDGLRVHPQILFVQKFYLAKSDELLLDGFTVSGGVGNQVEA